MRTFYLNAQNVGGSADLFFSMYTCLSLAMARPDNLFGSFTLYEYLYLFFFIFLKLLLSPPRNLRALIAVRHDDGKL